MSVPGPTLGPCQAWISGDDVADCCDLASNAASYDDAALDASMLLFELSGRLFPGICERTVRPCNDRCACGWGLSRWWADGPSWSGWCDDRGTRGCGCGALQQIKLAGYPVRQIDEVKIDGAVVDPATYRLDRWRYLVRLDDPGPPLEKRRWPSCQNRALADDQEGTFSVAYSWGTDPPPAGIHAAAELACQLYAACGGGECKIPSRATRVVRQGFEIDMRRALSFLGGSEPTGMPLVDAFLSAYAHGSRRRAAVWSPDMVEYPRPEGG